MKSATAGEAPEEPPREEDPSHAGYDQKGGGETQELSERDAFTALVASATGRLSKRSVEVLNALPSRVHDVRFFVGCEAFV